MKIREQVRKRQPLCLDCKDEGKTRGWDEVDHIIPLHLGGTDDLDNLVGRCKYHHQQKTNRDNGNKEGQAFDSDGMPIGDHHWREA